MILGQSQTVFLHAIRLRVIILHTIHTNVTKNDSADCPNEKKIHFQDTSSNVKVELRVLESNVVFLRIICLHNTIGLRILFTCMNS